MRNDNRLIDDFKNQTKATIWKHLDAMAANYAVYSTHLNGLSPFLKDYDMYLYCNDTNVVIMCLDSCGHGEEQTYEETKSLSPLILTEGKDPHVSVVWKLAEAVRFTKDCLLDKIPAINVFGVLLTEAVIPNSYELEDMWDAHHVMVIDDFKRLKYRKIKVNEDDNLASKAYITTIIDANIDTNSDDNPETCKEKVDQDLDEEFERLLDEFLNEEMEKVDEEEEDVEEEEEPLSNTGDDLQGDEDDSPTDALYPDGEIEQNQSISVKVEILRPIANPREELDKLVGCTGIKQRIDELIALTSYNKMMHELFPNSKLHEVSLHSLFLGRPGTGKTTVCKIFGSLLRQAGALSKGHVVVCERGTFLGTLWGDEERSIRQVIEMARGGVLMIDEAYLLNGKNDHDPGKLVIQLLMNILADETQRDIAVVLCGYKEPMMKLLDSNPGLYSRFPNKFEFTDFTVDELLEITRRRIKSYDYTFTAQAWERYSKIMAQAYQMRDPETWGNARFVANQLERIYIQHATRCVKEQPKDKGELLLITPEDILPIEIPRQKTRIGF